MTTTSTTAAAVRAGLPTSRSAHALASCSSPIALPLAAGDGGGPMVLVEMADGQQLEIPLWLLRNLVLSQNGGEEEGGEGQGEDGGADEQGGGEQGRDEGGEDEGEGGGEGEARRGEAGEGLRRRRRMWACKPRGPDNSSLYVRTRETRRAE